MTIVESPDELMSFTESDKVPAGTGSLDHAFSFLSTVQAAVARRSSFQEHLSTIVTKRIRKLVHYVATAARAQTPVSTNTGMSVLGLVLKITDRAEPLPTMKKNNRREISRVARVLICVNRHAKLLLLLPRAICRRSVGPFERWASHTPSSSLCHNHTADWP